LGYFENYLKELKFTFLRVSYCSGCMAPESLEDNKFSTPSDVWSFGVVMWEMDNPSEIPYSDINDAARLGIKLAKGLRLQIPKAYTPKVERIMKACWQETPELRPSFMLIAQLLTSFAFTTSSTTIT
jgi:serine/threonine protein kinase